MAEASLYRDPVLRDILPSLLQAHDNANGAVQSRSGFVYPPWIAMERGTTLTGWIKHARGYGEVLAMVESVARMLARLHGAGLVHRVCHCCACYIKAAQWPVLL